MAFIHLANHEWHVGESQTVGGGQRRRKATQFHQFEMPPQRTFGGDQPGDGGITVEAFVEHDRDAVGVQLRKLADVCRA